MGWRSRRACPERSRGDPYRKTLPQSRQEIASRKPKRGKHREEKRGNLPPIGVLRLRGDLRREAATPLRMTMKMLGHSNRFRRRPLAGSDSLKTPVRGRIHHHAQGAMVLVAQRDEAEGLQHRRWSRAPASAFRPCLAPGLIEFEKPPRQNLPHPEPWPGAIARRLRKRFAVWLWCADHLPGPPGPERNHQA